MVVSFLESKSEKHIVLTKQKVAQVRYFAIFAVVEKQLVIMELIPHELFSFL